MYNLKIIFQVMLLKNAKIYVPIIIFMSVGNIILFVMLSGAFSFFKPNKDMLKMFGEENYNIAVTYVEPLSFINQKAVSDNTPRAVYSSKADKYALFTSEDIEYIETSLTGSFDFKGFTQIAVPIYSGNAGNNELSLFYLSNAYFDFLRGQMGIDKPFVVASRGVIEDIKLELYEMPQANSLNVFPFDYDSGRDCFITIDRLEEIQIVYFDEIKNLHKLDTHGFVNVYGQKDSMVFDDSKVIYIPLEYLYHRYSWLANLNFNARITNISDADGVGKLLLYLSEAHSGVYIYKLEDAVANVFLLMREYNEIFMLFTTISVLLVIVATISFLGMQLIIFERQKRNIAIHISCGATRRTIVGRQLCVSAFITVLSAIIGSAAGFIITPLLDISLMALIGKSSSVVQVVPQIEGFYSLLVLAVFFSMFACTPTLWKVYTLAPKELLKE